MNTNPEITEIKNIVQQNRDILQQHSITLQQHGEILQRHGAILQQHGEILLEVVKEQNYLRGALDQINERFSTLDARMNSMENRIVSVENRMIALEDRMGLFDARLTDTYASLSKDIRDNFKWTIGLMIPVWFGILAAIAVELVKG
jgi:uncharacterized coiled-coil DUF342 family protein/predicted outer membrane lipoprotein